MNLFNFDKKLKNKNTFLIGTDEAGRGAGAGPVFAAAVCFQKTDKKLISELSEINDSKQLTEKQREDFYEIIIKNCVYDVQSGSVEEIARLNILQCSLFCMKRACENVISKIGKEKILVIVDGNKTIPNFEYPQQSVVKGDGKSATIAAASILAKVSRDRYMTELGKDFPQYEWEQNKGYLTPDHLDLVDKYGICEHHRKKYFEKHFAKQLSLF